MAVVLSEPAMLIEVRVAGGPNVPRMVRIGATLLIVALSVGASAYRASAQSPSPPAYGFLFTPPPASGSPAILKVELNSDRLRAGGPIDIRVTTTPDVVKVVTGNGKRQGTLTMTAPGVFTSESTLPRIGGLATIHIKLHFEATAASGASTSLDVPVSYH